MTTKIQNLWVVGFVDGEGCFRASIINNQSIKNKIQIQIEFVVTQHKRDVQILYALKTFFGCEQVSLLKSPESTNCCRYRVRKLDSLLDKIIPFFEKHNLKTKKHIEFIRFRKLCFLLKNKTHLSTKGFEEAYSLAKNLAYKEKYNENIV